MAGPKTFISYSWTSPDHEQWVIDLATQLVAAGIPIVLDKWDLKEGQDAFKFMEASVTDPEITKVIIVADRHYAEKANDRRGGVGTEPQIMSPKIFSQTDEAKFVAVLSELDEDNEPYLPTFLSARKYIDLSSEDRYATNFEQVLRWLYNKPLFVKPPLGKMPEFLNAESPRPPVARAKRSVELIQSGASSAPAATDVYLQSIIDGMEAFRLPPSGSDDAFPDRVLESIDAFLPVRNEFITLVFALARDPSAKLARTFQRFFEQIIPYMSRPAHINQWSTWDFDNFVFVSHELFLYTVAIMLRYERFDEVAELLEMRFYVPNEDHREETMRPFSVLWQPMESLNRKQSAIRRLSLRADLLHKRAEGSGVKFRDIMMADFVLFLRSAVANEFYQPWFPETLLYAREVRGPFEIFARSESATYWSKIAPMLAIKNKDELLALIGTFSISGQAGRWLPRWEHQGLPISRLSNVENLGSRA